MKFYRIIIVSIFLFPSVAYAKFYATIPGLDRSGIAVSSDFTIACEDNQGMVYDTGGATWQCEDLPGAAGGDSVLIDSVAVTDPDFVSTGDIDFVDSSNTVTANINADKVSNDEIAPQSVSTDQLQATVLPSDGQVPSYESDTPGRFKWLSCADITGSADLCDGGDASGGGGGQSVFVSEDASAVYNNESSDMIMDFGRGLSWAGSGQHRNLDVDVATSTAPGVVSFDETFISIDNARATLAGIGSDTEVLFNDNETVSTDAGMTYNKTTNALTADTFISSASNDPTVSFDSVTLGDSDYSMGINEDGGADDDDPFEMRQGGIPGTDVFLKYQPDTGVITLQGQKSGGNNEDLTLDCDSTANECIQSSTTSARLVYALHTEYQDDQRLQFGTGDDYWAEFETTGNDHLAWNVRVGNSGGAGYITMLEKSDSGDANRSPDVTVADPTFRVYSSDATEKNDYWQVSHDGTNAVIGVGNGGLVLPVDAVSGDEIATQAVSTDKLLASNKPVDEDCFTYESDTLGGQWGSCGSGAGDSITVDGGAVVDPDFDDGGDINFTDSSNTITATINADAVSNDEIAPQAVSTDQLLALNKPTDGQVFSYSTDGGVPSGEWIAAGGAETNTLETTITGIADTEVFIGNGADSGTFVAFTGDISLTNGGVTAIVADAVSNDEIAPQAVSTDQLRAVNNPTDGQVFAYESDHPTHGKWVTAGGGSTKFAWTLRPQQGKLPSSNAASIDASGTRWTGLYQDTGEKALTWESVLFPYQGGALSADITYTMATATANDVHLAVHIDCQNPGTAADFDTATFGTSDDIVVTVPGTAGHLGSGFDSSLNGDSCAQYDNIVVKIARNGGHADDTASGNAELRKVLISEV